MNQSVNQPMIGDRFRDSTAWQEIAGYSRASRIGNLIAVSGTTADLDSLPPEHFSSTYHQVKDALSRGLAAVEALGGTVNSIIRTRMFLVSGADPLEASHAHAELLGHVSPANTTLFVHSLVGDNLLVEIEVESIVQHSTVEVSS